LGLDDYDSLGSFEASELPPGLRLKREGVVQTLVRPEVPLCCGNMPYNACVVHANMGLFCADCFQNHLRLFHPSDDRSCDECGEVADRLMPMIQAMDFLLEDEDHQQMEAHVHLLGWGLCFDCLPRRAKLQVLRSAGRGRIN
jgi:hypothetical protein